MSMRRITKEGLHEMHDRLRQLEIEKKEVIQRQQQARSYGDLKENSEYQKATSRLFSISNEIIQLGRQLESSTVIENNTDNSKVMFGSFVTIKDLMTSRESQYRLVDEIEADFMNGKLAYNSPFAQVLLNKKKDDIIEYTARNNIRKYQIISIN